MFRLALALALALPLVAQADPDHNRQSQRDAAFHERGHVSKKGHAHKSRRHRSVVLDKRRLEKRVDAIDRELDALADLLAKGARRADARRSASSGQGARGRHHDGESRRRHRQDRHDRAVAEQLAEVRARLKSLHRVVAEARPAPRRPKVRPAAPQAMSKSQFKRLIRALDDAPFRDDKRAVLRRALPHHHFTSAQARTIAREFPFSDGKVAALTALHPRVVDPENFEQVYSDLNFSRARQQLDQNIYASNSRSRRR